jgi:hypothetical protein
MTFTARNKQRATVKEETVRMRWNSELSDVVCYSRDATQTLTASFHMFWNSRSRTRGFAIRRVPLCKFRNTASDNARIKKARHDGRAFLF